VFGILLAFAGAAVLASREFAFNPGPAAVVGALAVTAGAASYAVGASYLKSRIQSTDRYVVAGGTLVFAAIYVWLLALVADGAPILPTEPVTIVGLLWLGLLGSFFAYILYFYLISHLGATVATMVTFVFPVVGVTLGVVVLDEVLDARLLLGAGLVVLGIAIVGLRYDRVVSLATRAARR
jgi:drug/metabolite transporter (DMT)-like permease